MTHTELHAQLSATLKQLVARKIKPTEAKEIFNGSGKIIANCKNEIATIQMGYPVDIPLMGIKQADVNKQLRIETAKPRLKK